MLWGFQLSTITFSLIPITKSIKASSQRAASASSWEFSVPWMTAIRLHTCVPLAALQNIFLAGFCKSSCGVEQKSLKKIIARVTVHCIFCFDSELLCNVHGDQCVCFVC